MRNLRLALLILGLLLIFAPAPTLGQNTIEVGVGGCTLADAITAANTDAAAGSCAAGSGDDSIVLTADVTLTAVLPSISSTITFTSAGERRTIDGDGRFRIFTIHFGSAVIDNLTLTNASQNVGGNFSAIEFYAGYSLTITNSIISNSHTAGAGSVLAIDQSTISCNITISNSTISGNTASNSGGAIFSACPSSNGSITITNSTFSGNISESSTTSGSGGGGAIFTRHTSLNIENSTFSNNQVIGKGDDFGGGALYLSGVGTATIRNSTFSGNQVVADPDDSTTTGHGAAIFSKSRLRVENSTFYDNSLSIGNGGGVYVSQNETSLTHVTMSGNTANSGTGVYSANGTLNLRNSLLDSGTGANACFGMLNENINNLIEDNSCSPYLTGNPRLAGLRGNPGYYPLASESPARDAAHSDHCLATDQTGYARPYGAACDIGAYEWRAPLPKQTRSSGGGSDDDGVSQHSAIARLATCAILQETTGIMVTATHGLHSGLQCQRLGPAGVGVQSVHDLGFLDAVDVWGWVEQGVETCFPQMGGIIFLDASTSPRTISPIETYSRNNFSCAYLNRAGTLALVSGIAPPPALPTTAANPQTKTLQNCMVTLTHILNFRDGPAGNILDAPLPAFVMLTALERTEEWIRVDYHGTLGWISAAYVTPNGDCS